MYLYVARGSDLDELPAALMARFGEPALVMCIPLTAERKLARADAAEVLRRIAEYGYFLQMPPAVGETTPGQKTP